MSFIPSVCLTMPQYDNRLHTDAAYAFYHAPSKHQDVQITGWVNTSSSLLGQAFNSLFAHALNERDKGNCTHFAMLHSDIGPEAFWLDKLWHIMRETEADVISVVVPIKEPERQRTSTAIGLEADPWKIVKYITAADRGELPTTFRPVDVCEPGEVMLINTGLWLADIRKPYWDEFPGFNIVSEIRKNDDGHRQSKVRPEDWELSRFLHSKGVDYRATWSVSCVHYGSHEWPNYSVTKTDG